MRDFATIKEIPEGWYEKQFIDFMTISDNVTVYRSKIDDGVIQYQIAIDEEFFSPIPKALFEKLNSEYSLSHAIMYKYLDEDFKTYIVLDLKYYYVKIMPQ